MERRLATDDSLALHGEAGEEVMARRTYKKTGPAYMGGSHGRGKSWWFVESKGYHHPKRSFRTRRFATLYRKYIEDTLSESGHKKYTYDRATKTGTYAPSTFGGWLRGRN